jgi:hypothetical protein
MRKYRNVSGILLHIDCIAFTKHLGVGEVAMLPVSRDVRHLTRTRQIVLVKDKPKSKPSKSRRRGRPRKQKKKFSAPKIKQAEPQEKSKEPLKDMETK